MSTHGEYEFPSKTQKYEIKRDARLAFLAFLEDSGFKEYCVEEKKWMAEEY